MVKKKVKEIPVIIKIISILYYISAGTTALSGLSMILLSISGFGISLSNSLLGDMTIMLFGGILLIGTGVLLFFIGRGLWKMKKWARITAIIFLAIGIINAIISISDELAVSIIKITLQIAIGIYLLFSKDVKKAFK